MEKNAKPIVVKFVEDVEENGKLEEVGRLTISWDDDAIKIEASRIDEAVTGSVTLEVF